MNPFCLSHPECHVGDTDTYVICLCDNYISNEINNSKIKLFYSPDTKVEQLYELVNLISIMKMPFQSTYTMKQDAIIFVKGNQLSGFFPDEKKELNEMESVYLMLESKYCDVKKWKKLYEDNNSLFKFIRQKIFYSYNKLHDDVIANELLSLISNISPNPYCFDKVTCAQINKTFEERQFCAQRLDNLDPNQSLVLADIINLHERITELLVSKSLSEKERLYLICNLMINENYYYFVINNSTVLYCVRDIFEKYSSLFRYLWNYAWMFAWDSEQSRSFGCVFDIHAASNLPFFDGDNPYLTLAPKTYHITNSGIVNLSKFRRRLNFFTSGSVDNDIFMNMNWKNVAICGEIMASIMPIKNVKSDNINIDMVCYSLDIIEYVDRALHIYETVSRNLINSDLQIKQKDIKLVTKKCLTITIDAKTLKMKCENQEIPFEYHFVIANLDNLQVKHHFYKLYVTQKQSEDILSLSKLEEKKNMPEYYEIIKLVDINNVVIVINDHGIKFNESLQYKIISKHLRHSIKISCADNILHTVADFCLPCMRSYYDGENCYLLPSAVVAYLTLVNSDVNFMNKKQDPCRVINEYRRRGYFTVLNKFETDQFNRYFAPQEQQINIEKINRLICDGVIDKEGNVIPVKKWLIDYAYDQKN
uniref:Uncharacterized protein n=1 Tax=viral metagenome TaxID=1070528 RepID=A0A6C0C9N6_9ZZZZ